MERYIKSLKNNTQKLSALKERLAQNPEQSTVELDLESLNEMLCFLHETSKLTEAIEGFVYTDQEGNYYAD